MPLFTIRTAVVLLGAGIVGIVAFFLALHASPARNVAAATLVAAGAAGGALVTFNTLLATALV